MPDKSPYGNHSVEDVFMAEVGNYYIQVGHEIFEYEGKMVFSRDRAEAFFDDIVDDLNDLKENGDELEKKNAHKNLLYLKIFPFRVH
jgi:hypothetical protein